MRIACLGDSLTGPSLGATYRDKYLKWTDLLQFGIDVLLGAGKAEVLNRGKAGDSSFQVREDLEKRLFECDPDIVVVLLGANDYSPQYVTAQTPVFFEKNLTEIVRLSRDAGIRPLLLQYPDPKADDMKGVWLHGNLGNAIISKVAMGESVPLLNLKIVFDEASATRSLSELTSPVDGLHLNPGGELVLAEAVLQKLRELNWV